MSIDTLDVLAVVSGVIVGMVAVSSLEGIAPGLTRSDYADLIIGGCAFGMLAAKRQVVAAPPKAPAAGPALRMTYLMAAILGSLGLLSALGIVWWGDAQGISRQSAVPVGGLGAVLFAVAVFVERVYLTADR